jgi:hypothetical protein
LGLSGGHLGLGFAARANLAEQRGAGILGSVKAAFGFGDDSVRALSKVQNILNLTSSTPQGQLIGSALAFNLLTSAPGEDVEAAREELMRVIPGEAGKKIKEAIMEVRSDAAIRPMAERAFGNIVGKVGAANIQKVLALTGEEVTEENLAKLMATVSGVSATSGGAKAEAIARTSRGGEEDRANLEVLRGLADSLRIQREFNVSLLEFVRGEKINVPSHPSGSRGK